MNTIKKDFIRYVSGSVAGMIGLSVYILADTFFVSKALGINGLAALNFAVPIYSLIHGAGLMLGIGGGTNYTFFRGLGENEKANKVFTSSVLWGIILGVMFLLAGVFMPHFIAGLLGAEGVIVDLTAVYLRVILCFALAFIMNNVLLAFVRNDNAPSLAMLGMILGSLSNIVLDYVFMFPLGMGMFGAAVATGIAPVISIAVLSVHFIRKNNRFHFVHKNNPLRLAKRIFGQGISSFVTELASAVTMIVFNILIMKVGGDVCVAAYGIIANVALVVIAIFTGIAQGIQPIISKSHALEDTTSIKAIVKYGITTSLVLSAIIYVFSFIYADGIVSIFNSEGNTTLQDISRVGIYLYFIGFFFAGVNVVMTSYYNSVGITKRAFVISILRGAVVIVPVSVIMSLLWGMNGVWCSFLVTEIITFLIWQCMRIKNKRKNKGTPISAAISQHSSW